MSIIPCALDCIHQQDGYCCLETTSQVTNTSGGCAHYEHKGNGGTSSKRDASAKQPRA